MLIWISKGISISCKVITLPLFLSLLNIEEYAALAILVGLESWFLLLDFGLGISIQNFISETFSEEDRKALIKSAFVFGAIACGLGSILLAVSSSILSQFFLSNCPHLDSPFEMFFLASSFLLLGTFGSLGGRILMAEQRGGIFYLVQSSASLLSLAFLYFFRHQIHLKEAIILALGVPSMASFLITASLLKKVDWKAPLRLDVLKRARKFGLFAFMAACVLSSDALIVPKVLDPDGITQYNVLCKLFSPIAFTYSAWLQAFWPTCSELWAQGKGSWITKKIAGYSLLGVSAAFIFTVILILMTGPIERFLKLSLPLAGIVWGGLYLSVRIVSDFHAMALQSRSDLKPFFYLVPIQAAISLLLQCVFSFYWGSTGILMGLTVSYLLTVCWALPRRLHHVKQRVYV